MTAPHSNTPPIAVVGLGALFPGSSDISGFWRDVVRGVDRITDVPATHWLPEDYFDPDPTAPDRTYCRRGAFLSPVAFDPLEFGVPPAIVPATDTAQLLALMVARAALHDFCGGPLPPAARARTSVILGVTSGQELLGTMVSRLQRPVWIKALRELGWPEDQVQAACARIADHYVPWVESTFPGLLGNVVAGRIANRFDLGGTNLVTDAACASTFAAVHAALHELAAGDADLVLTGGVDTSNDIFMFTCFSKTPALSPTGDCRPFSAAADGTMLGEGLGMLVLKRLADAERDGDRIHAVLRGVGTSSDGRARSIYAPVSDGQARALRRAYAAAGVDPATVELIEAHGTGTVAGDLAEFRGLQQVFDPAAAGRTQRCALGSVKSQIGHTKAAAGAAGLIKAILALGHRVLPPTIKVERPDPRLEIDASAFYLNTTARPWISAGAHPRRAGVSSFGFGGTNFHVVVEEYVGPAPKAMLHDTRPGELVLVSAGSAPELAAACRELAAATGAATPHGDPATSPATPAPAASRRDATAAGSPAPPRDPATSPATPVPAASRRDTTAASSPATPRDPATSPAPAASLAWLARDSQRRFDRGAHARLAVVARDEAELAALLRAVAGALDTGAPLPPGVRVELGPPAPGGLALACPGQGSQYLGMGAALALHFEPARRVWDTAAACLPGPVLLHDVAFPPPAFGDAAREQQRARLTATEWAQPALAAAGAAALAVLRACGVRPDAAFGHSFGELTALHAADALDLPTLLRAARIRGERMRDASEVPGAMSAVSGSIDQVRPVLAAHPGVVLANHNAPRQVVIAGPSAAVERAEAALRGAGLSAQRLAVATAFHSPLVAPASEAFAAALSDLPLAPPAVPVISCSEVAPYPADPATARAWLTGQLARPVRFVDQVEALYARGIRTFVEIGPGGVLTGLVARCLEGRPHRAVALDDRHGDGVLALLRALGELAVAGLALDLEPLWEGLVPPRAPEPAAKRLTVPICGANHGKPYPPPGGAAALPPPNPPTAAPSARTDMSPGSSPTPPLALAAPSARTDMSPGSSPTPPRPLAPAAPSARTDMSPGSSPTPPSAPAAPSARTDMSPGSSPIPPLAPAAPSARTDMSPGSSRPLTRTGPEPAATAAASSARQDISARTLVPAAPARLDRPSTAAPSPAASGRQDMSAGPPTTPPRPDPLAAPSPGPHAHGDMSAGPPTTPRPPASFDPSRSPPSPTPMSTRTPVSSPTAAWLDAHREIFGQLAAAQAAYQRAMADSHLAYLQVAHASLAALHGGEVAPLDLRRPAVPDPLAPQPALAPPRPAVPEAPAPELTVAPLDMSERTYTAPREDSLPARTPPSSRAPALAAADGPARPTAPPHPLDASAHRSHGPAGTTSAPPALDAAGHGSDMTVRTAQTPRPPAPAAGAGDMSAGPSRAPVDPAAVLLAVVADKTGYPADMLRLDMALESDLGIDSIKRVEILSALRERIPALPDLPPAALGDLRTLGDIVALLHRGTYPPGSPPAAPTPTVDPAAVLLAVVADKTGYPADMLRLDMALESDLGIDSIKRVEILSALRERIPALPDLPPAALGDLRTLGDIVALLHPGTGAPAAPATVLRDAAADAAADGPRPGSDPGSDATRLALVPPASPAPAARIGRYVPRLHPAPAAGFRLPHLDRGPVVVTDDGGGIADALVTELRSHGLDARVVADPGLLPAETRALIVLDGLHPDDDLDAGLRACRRTLAFARAFAPRAARGEAVFVTVQDTGGRFGLDGAPIRPGFAGLAAFTRTAAREWPAAACRAIDLERAGRPVEQVAMDLSHELLRGGPELEVGLGADGSRATIVAGLAPTDAEPRVADDRRTASVATNRERRAAAVSHGTVAATEPVALAADGVWVFTGGARGITPGLAEALARRGVGRIVLVGRTALTDEPACCRGVDGDAALKRALLAAGSAAGPAELRAQVQQIEHAREVRRTLARLQEAGAEVRYLALDLCDRTALTAALAGVRDAWGPITGLVHAAGVLADRAIADKTDAELDRVLAAKIDGLRALLAATADDPVRTLVLFSSIAARTGNPGQCDYAAANEILNKLAWTERARRGDGCRVKALGWGPWQGGMVTPELARHFSARGVPLIEPDVGAALLLAELARAPADDVEVVLGALDHDPGDMSRTVEADLVLDAAAAPDLGDHAPAGAPVVPIALAIEWFARGVAALRPGRALAVVRGLQVLRGIKLPRLRRGGHRLRLSLQPVSSDIFIATVADESGAPGIRAELVSGPLASIPAPQAPLGPPASYTGPLFHGPAFHVLGRPERLDAAGAAAPVAGALAQGWPGEFRSDPAALDGALQLALLWLERAAGGRALPLSIARVDLHAAGPWPTPARCELQGGPTNRSKGTCSIDLKAPDGRPLAALTGVELVVYAEESRELGRAAHD